VWSYNGRKGEQYGQGREKIKRCGAIRKGKKNRREQRKEWMEIMGSNKERKREQDGTKKGIDGNYVELYPKGKVTGLERKKRKTNKRHKKQKVDKIEERIQLC
jgi:hypothetical protein